MDYYLFIVDSATAAQRMAQVLRRGGLRTDVQRLPAALAGQGCAYAVRVTLSQYENALSLLRGSRLEVRRIVRRTSGGYSEVDA